MNLLTDSREVEPAVPAGTKSLDEAYNEFQIATGKINKSDSPIPVVVSCVNA